MADTTIRRSYKDSLFRMIFREKTALLSLYNAVNGSDYQNPDDLEINTIADVLYMGMKNDVSFIIDHYLNLYEAQSTWNPNMPLRGLLYISRVYQGYIEVHHFDIYSETLLELPTPQYIVFYNGQKDKPDIQKLKLSDSFIRKDGTEHAVECVATMFNINYGHNEKLMRNCRKLYEYAYLINEIRRQLSEGQALGEAVDQAVTACINAGILESFLRRHRTEVRAMILTEYNEELHLKTVKEEGYQKGLEKGLKDKLYPIEWTR